MMPSRNPGERLVHTGDARNDKPEFNLTMNLTNRKRGIRTGLELTIDHLACLNDFGRDQKTKCTNSIREGVKNNK